MLFQLDSTLMFILWLILATVIVALILYISVLLIASKTKASDKKFVIVILAFIFVLIIPIILGAINQVLVAIGDLVAFSGSNYLTQLTPIIGFLIILVIFHQYTLGSVCVDIPIDTVFPVSTLYYDTRAL